MRVSSNDRRRRRKGAVTAVVAIAAAAAVAAAAASITTAAVATAATTTTPDASCIAVTGNAGGAVGQQRCRCVARQAQPKVFLHRPGPECARCRGGSAIHWAGPGPRRRRRRGRDAIPPVLRRAWRPVHQGLVHEHHAPPVGCAALSHRAAQRRVVARQPSGAGLRQLLLLLLQIAIVAAVVVVVVRPVLPSNHRADTDAACAYRARAQSLQFLVPQEALPRRPTLRRREGPPPPPLRRSLSLVVFVAASVAAGAAATTYATAAAAAAAVTRRHCASGIATAVAVNVLAVSTTPPPFPAACHSLRYCLPLSATVLRGSPEQSPVLLLRPATTRESRVRDAVPARVAVCRAVLVEQARP
jgi:hypothetical protein